MATTRARKTPIQIAEQRALTAIRELATLTVESGSVDGLIRLDFVRATLQNWTFAAQAAISKREIETLKENPNVSQPTNVSQTNSSAVTSESGKDDSRPELHKSPSRQIRPANRGGATASDSNGGKRKTRPESKGTVQPGKIGGNGKTRKMRTVAK